MRLKLDDVTACEWVAFVKPFAPELAELRMLLEHALRWAMAIVIAHAVLRLPIAANRITGGFLPAPARSSSIMGIRLQSWRTIDRCPKTKT